MQEVTGKPGNRGGIAISGTNRHKSLQDNGGNEGGGNAIDLLARASDRSAWPSAVQAVQEASEVLAACAQMCHSLA